MAQTVVQYTTGEVGAGKTYLRCASFLVNFFFNPAEAAPEYFWSNFPIEFDGLQSVLEKRYPGKYSRQEIERRCRVFPAAVVESWRTGRVGPWKFFIDENIDLSDTHVSIDEIHVFCPRGGKHVAAWEDWLGEIRHEGATIEFLTQSPRKVAKCIEIHAGVRLRISKCDTERDPFASIEMFEWYQLFTVFGWPYVPAVREQTLRNDVDEKMRVVDEKVWRFDRELFTVYKTNSASHFSGKSGRSSLLPYQRFGKVRLVCWFFSRNWWRFIVNYWSVRSYVIVCFLWAAFNFGFIVETFAKKQKPLDEPGPLPGEVNADLEMLDPVVNADRKSVLTARDVDFGEKPIGGGDFQFGPMGPVFKALPPKAADKVSIVGISPGRCWDVNGRSYGVGDELGGSTIWVVEYEKRQVRFNDGSIAPVLVFGMPATGQAVSNETETDVPNVVRPTSPAKTETATSAGTTNR